MTFRRDAMTLVLAGLLSGCVAGGSSSTRAPKPGACPVDRSMVQTTFYFGLSRPAGKNITAKEWQQFVDRDATPRFRDGLTVFDARDQWLGQNDQVVREQSEALMVIHGSDVQSEAGIKALRQGYKSCFMQESVMCVGQPVCVQFRVSGGGSPAVCLTAPARQSWRKAG